MTTTNQPTTAWRYKTPTLFSPSLIYVLNLFLASPKGLNTFKSLKLVSHLMNMHHTYLTLYPVYTVESMHPLYRVKLILLPTCTNHHFLTKYARTFEVVPKLRTVLMYMYRGMVN